MISHLINNKKTNNELHFELQEYSLIMLYYAPTQFSSLSDSLAVISILTEIRISADNKLSGTS